MKIIIDIGHPAHVHLFRNFANEFIKKGHKVLFTAREKDCAIELLKAYKLDFKKLGKNYKTTTGKIWGLISYEILLTIISLKFRPDIYISHGSFYAAWIAFLLRKPHIALEDTGNMEQVRLYLPFTDVILTSTSFIKKISKKQIYYNGYHELAYLHPQYFVPFSGLKSMFGFTENERIILLRFVERKSTHDLGYTGLTDNDKLEIVARLGIYGRIMISSEEELPEKLKVYAYRIAPENFHSLINIASLIFCNSATVASEAAMLGIPAIYLDNVGRFYTTELNEKYGLVLNFKENKEGIESSLVAACKLLEDCRTSEIWQKKRSIMLSEKINLTKFLVWFVEKFPNSYEEVQQNAQTVNNFK